MKKYFFIAFLVFCFGCGQKQAHTTVGFKNPDFDGESYQKILIVAGSNNENFSKDLEDSVFRVFSNKKIESMQAKSLISPFKAHEYSKPEKLWSLVNKKGFDSMLVIGLIDYRTSKVQMPIFFDAQTNYYDYQTSSSGSISGGGTLSIQDQKYFVCLIDVKNQEPIWRAEFIESGLTQNQIFSGLANGIFKAMKNDQLILVGNRK